MSENVLRFSRASHDAARVVVLHAKSLPEGGVLSPKEFLHLASRRFAGDIRFPTSFSGGESYLSYDDLKHRIDKKITWYHQTEKTQYNFQPFWYPVVDAGIRGPTFRDCVDALDGAVISAFVRAVKPS